MQKAYHRHLQLSDHRAMSSKGLLHRCRTLLTLYLIAGRVQLLTAYVEQFAGLKPGLDKTRELVETIARQIDQSLAAAQELDANIAGQFI